MAVPITLYLLALVVRAVASLHFPDPAYPNSSYYVDVAQSLAAGRGFSIDFIWIFPEVGGRIPLEPVLPIPSNAHWMPLSSIVQVPFIVLFGATSLAAFASTVPFLVIGALTAPMAWAFAREAGSPEWIARGAGVLTAIPALLTPFMAQPDNFGLYQPLVLGALWMAARGIRGDRRAFVLAGLLTGVATLARNDGLLVLGSLGVVFLWEWVRARRAHRAPLIPLTTAIGAVVAFAIVMVPWYVRQLAVFGTISPSTASGKVFFIRSIDEWNSISIPADLEHLLGMGLGPLLATRVDGFVSAVVIYSVLVGAVLLVPFMFIGAWQRRWSVWFGPFFVYAIILFAFSALLSAVHVPGGTFIHSACALVPFSYILGLEGIAASAAWVGRRRATWNGEQAGRIFGMAAIGLSIIAAAFATWTVHLTWDHVRQERIDVAAALDDAGAPDTERLMTIDAAGYRYWTGHGGVVLVNDPLDTIEQVAQAYDIRWLVLERGNTVPSMEPVIVRDERPAWIGPSLASSTGTDGQTVWAVYPVCVAPGDARCG